MRGFTALLLVVCSAALAAEPRLPIPEGDFTPVLAPGPAVKTAHVRRFRLDRRPVTNAAYASFVHEHPEWQRGRVTALYADAGYLADWTDAEHPPPGREQAPVTGVSWYAARAYCAAHHGRLPTWLEWEYAAAADETRRDARADTAWREVILSWYAQSGAHAPGDVGQHAPNVYGIQDLHGLVWEWVEDFSSLLVSGDSRDQGSPDRLKFCGAGALSAESRDDYPVLMRIALLSSLEANYATGSLGLRCAEDE